MMLAGCVTLNSPNLTESEKVILKEVSGAKFCDVITEPVSGSSRDTPYTLNQIDRINGAWVKICKK